MVIKSNDKFKDRQVKTVAFDVYGTLIDTNGVFIALEKIIGTNANSFMGLWRSKQLEYTFRRGLMQNYVDFTMCTKQAFEYACDFMNLNISVDNKKRLIDEYNYLPAFPDVINGLEKLKSLDCNLYAFSNGKVENVDKLLEKANIREYFIDVISVDEIKSYKPNPAVYSHLLRRTNSLVNGAWLISCNPFDVIGAVSSGLLSAWIKRTPTAVFDPWEINPTATIESINDLPDLLG